MAPRAEAVTSVIIGAKSRAADGQIAASDLVLTAEELEALDQAGALPMEYPGG